MRVTQDSSKILAGQYETGTNETSDKVAEGFLIIALSMVFQGPLLT